MMLLAQSFCLFCSFLFFYLLLLLLLLFLFQPRSWMMIMLDDKNQYPVFNNFFNFPLFVIFVSIHSFYFRNFDYFFCYILIVLFSSSNISWNVSDMRKLKKKIRNKNDNYCNRLLLIFVLSLLFRLESLFLLYFFNVFLAIKFGKNNFY